jgi:hypothetical protein
VLVEAPNRDPDGIEDSPTCPVCGKLTRLSRLRPCQDLGKELQIFACCKCDVRVQLTVDEFGRLLPRMPVKTRLELGERRSAVAWTTASEIFSTSIALAIAASALRAATVPRNVAGNVAT